MVKEEQQAPNGIVTKPIFGSIMAVAAGLSFFFLCMILPLVGPAGSRTAHTAKNKATFLGVLLITLLLAIVAVYSKMLQRKKNGTPLPYWSLGLCVICLLTLIVLLVDGFAI